MNIKVIASVAIFYVITTSALEAFSITSPFWYVLVGVFCHEVAKKARQLFQ